MYMVLDCNGKPAGNPKGYRTYRGARIQSESRHGKAYRDIWSAYWTRYTNDMKEYADNVDRHGRLVYTIKLIEG